MGRDDNIEIFTDTEKLCKTNSRLSESIKKSVAGQKAILEADVLPTKNLKLNKKPADIVVSKKRTFEAASGYKGQKIAVHNFASATSPGGGVKKGASAQEECLCRCSGLFFCLNTPAMWAGFYTPHRNAQDAIHNDDIIYTPAITVFKTDTSFPKLMNESDWYDVNVITCAAPNLRPNPSNQYNQRDGQQAVRVNDNDLFILHEKRLRRILDVAIAEGNEVVILGAFGCGAFANNPKTVALAAKKVIADYAYAFKQIEFAVYCSPRDESNYEIFKSVLGSNQYE